MDLDEAVTYRLAYGLAKSLAEADDANHPGRLRNNRAAGGNFATILAEVLARIPAAEQGGDVGWIREGVEDALAGRRPRW